MSTTHTVHELRRLLPEELSSLPLYCFATIDSTNAEGKRTHLPAHAGAALILAQTQTHGRGRMDRSFYSPAESGLYMTFVLRTSAPHGRMQGLTPAVAVAAAEAINTLTEQTVDIKWVNDLYRNGRKVGGILVEAVPDPDMAVTRLIMGIGINLTTKEFPDGLRAPAGALSDTGTVPTAEALAAAITARLWEIVPHGLQNGFVSLLPRYRALSLLKPGSPVNVYRGINSTPHPATVLGIADDFSLSVQFPDGQITTLSDGEVSVRSMENDCL